MVRDKIKAYSLVEMSVIILIVSVLMAGAYGAFNVIMVNTKKNMLIANTLNSPVARIQGLSAWYEAPTQKFTFFNDWGLGGIRDIDTWFDRNPQLISKKNLTGRGYLDDTTIAGMQSVFFTWNWAWMNSELVQQSDLVSSEGNTLFLVSRCGMRNGGVCGSPFAISYVAGCTDWGNYGNAKYELIVDHMWNWFCYSIIGESRNGQSVCGTYDWSKWRGKNRIMTFQNNPSKFFIRIDGETFAENTSINPNYMQIGSTPVRINVGCGPGGSQTYRDFWEGRVSEIILYNTPLSEKQISEVESYLSKKYDIPLSK